ncbi:HlyD family efflux transporter periplasmic adaptor subunit [Sabulilitoribacter arenilitoris]|uniref:HlyD family efflux transporter periplasmic adaptor subunit n=1 Tax=Wocania arenilitoris TaxID=2044858 RepID=A0AAE3EPP6_9FLAO|nr:HlyD family secretion protein [Wocania arenilitoris]MCF7569383.1 HlyD family efflux transporter periplasmic adaptor subunit [Wocania arenilitoris]
MNKKRLTIIIGAILLLIISYFYFGANSDEDSSLTSKVVKTDFINEIITSGEVRSTSLKNINGPRNLRKFRLRDVKIQDLIAEGTIVKKGDYVGRLDPAEVNEQILDARLNLESAQSQFIQQQLDTTLTLKQERNAIKDLQFNIEENKLELKQSIYEPPATIKKLEITIKKLERDLREKKDDYDIKIQQAKAKMVEVSAEVTKNQKSLDALLDLLKSFTIHSESDGMVTYVTEWDGRKKKVGSSISAWNPAIASLPDLSKMESRTFANEVDIRKIKKDMPVTVGFDAFPEIQLEGIVTDVANVGEKKRGSDIKVFQILIKLLKTDDNIRPGMTTSNKILTYTEKDVLTIPLESVFTIDSITYVYKKSGLSTEKRQVILGKSNNNDIIVKQGLQEDDIIFLSKPENSTNETITLIK